MYNIVNIVELDDVGVVFMLKSWFGRICVFCGSSSGRKDVFINEVFYLG